MLRFFRTSKLVTHFSKNNNFILYFLFIIQAIIEVFSIFTILLLINEILNVSNYELQEYFNFDRKTFIYVLTIFSIVIIIINFFLNLLINYKIINFSFKIYVDISSDLFNKFINSSYLGISKYSFAFISSKILNETRRLCEFVIIPYYIIVSKLFIFLIVTVGLLIYNWIVTLSALSIITSFFIVFYIFTRSKIATHGRLISFYDKEILSIFSNSFFGFKDIKLNNLSLKNFHSFYLSQNKLSNVLKEVKFIASSARYGIEFFLFISLMIIILILNEYDSLNEKVFATIGFCLFIVLKMIPYFNAVYLNFSFWKSHYPSYENINKLSNELDNVDAKFISTKKTLSNKIETLEIKNFKYRYLNTEANFEINDFNISKKGIIGVTGKSGSGKTTFLDIISGFIIPEKNNEGFFVNGIKLDENLKENYYKKISYVQQKIFLLGSTLKENIIFSEEIHEQKLQEVLELTKCDDFIDQKRLNQKINLGRENLSGGQIQRIGLARALYKNPDILILDEATNALDENLEYEIINNIKNNFKESFIFVSTHNPNILKICDLLIKVKDRKIYI